MTTSNVAKLGAARPFSKSLTLDGLGSLTGVQHVSAGSAFDNLDAFSEAISKAETVGATLTAFVAHPTQLLALSKLKAGTDFNVPLLGFDPTSPSKRSILGVPAYWSPSVDTSTVWGLAQAKSFVVFRQPTTVVADTSAFFSSDRTALRAVVRAGFAWPHQAAVIKIGVGGS